MADQDDALKELMKEFALELNRPARGRLPQETRWSRLARWCELNPEREVFVEGVPSNSVQRLRRRFPFLTIKGEFHRYTETGHRLCDLRVIYVPGQEEA